MSDKHEEMAVGVVEPIGDGHIEAMLTRPGLPIGTLLYDASALRQVERETLEVAEHACLSIGKDIVCPEECAAAIRALNVSTANELPTTPELADEYVRVPRVPSDDRLSTEALTALCSLFLMMKAPC